MEPIEDVIAKAEQRAVEEWEFEQHLPPPWSRHCEGFKAEITRTRLGYTARIGCGCGLTELANCWPFAFTRKGIRRKADRIGRRHFKPPPPVLEVVR